MNGLISSTNTNNHNAHLRGDPISYILYTMADLCMWTEIPETSRHQSILSIDQLLPAETEMPLAGPASGPHGRALSRPSLTVPTWELSRAIIMVI